MAPTKPTWLGEPYSVVTTNLGRRKKLEKAKPKASCVAKISAKSRLNKSGSLGSSELSVDDMGPLFECPPLPWSEERYSPPSRPFRQGGRLGCCYSAHVQSALPSRNDRLVAPTGDG